MAVIAVIIIYHYSACNKIYKGVILGGFLVE